MKVSLRSQWSECTTHEVTGTWEDVQCTSDGMLGFGCDEIERCKEEAVGNTLGAFMTCFTLIFALMGVLTRIRRKADTNFQKILGCIPDTFGVFSLGQALVMFASGCAMDMPETVIFNGHRATVHYWAGPGYFAYWFCWLTQVIRVIFHWVTPVPGGGMYPLQISKKLANRVARTVSRTMNHSERRASSEPRVMPGDEQNSGLSNNATKLPPLR